LANGYIANHRRIPVSKTAKDLRPASPKVAAKLKEFQGLFDRENTWPARSPRK